MKKIAVIGCGIMGAGIASNFLKNGCEVFVWNRTKNKVNALIKGGAKVVDTPREAAEKADIVFEVTANDQSSKAVWLGRDGILAGSDPKKVLIASGTFSVAWIDELARLTAKKRITFFDMPLTGGRQGAESGHLILLAGGDKKKLKLLDKDLKAIAEQVLYFGKTGSGMRFKLLLNTLQAIHIQGFGEMMKIAKKVGLNIKDVGSALAQRPGGVATNNAWNFFLKEPNPINFSVEWITKDLTYTKDLAKKLDTPLLNEALKKYKKAVSLKMAQRDFTTVNKI
ncbi:MAG TPA: NAD(P)-dependent oxidoreductase [Candidatus Saccharimonadales bacterium]|nr:NAD(P)-dependent oxidoreductase [Candidatus Saccharimonadales bacterium]